MPTDSSRYAAVADALVAGQRILMDGATGSELGRRGVPQLRDAWSGGGALTHPEVVRAVHADHLRAGARILISNTFSTLRSALQDAGMAEHFELLNARGVTLALDAREEHGTDDVVVAGGISHWSWTRRQPSPDELHANAVEQATIMAEAGADLLVLEMMVDIERMRRVLDAAQSTGLPVWVGFTCGTADGRPVTDDGVVRLRGGEPLDDAVAALDGRGVPVVTLMHMAVGLVDDGLDVLDDSWSGAVGVYAQSGDFVDNRWVHDGVISPEAYADHAQRWLDRGVQVIGGCCGIGPDHIRRLAPLLGPAGRDRSQVHARR